VLRFLSLFFLFLLLWRILARTFVSGRTAPRRAPGQPRAPIPPFAEPEIEDAKFEELPSPPPARKEAE